MDIKKKILIVEDSADLAQVYQQRFDIEGFTTKVVNDGESALASALDFRPDLILLDVMMPEISGFDVLDILKNTPKTANIKIILLTALSQPADKARAASFGVDDYLVKSETSLEDIVTRVKSIA
jgi:DNA-binding response OmpR family regulator